MRALVSGDRGFLGRHFAAELRARGYEVYGLDVNASPAQDCRSYFRAYLSRGREYREILAGHWDLVVHCAAVVGGRETIDGDPLATAESLSIDAEMFRWAAVARPGRVLYFSSSAAYPVRLQVPGYEYRLREDFVDLAEGLDMPDQVYGWSKVTGELLAARLREAGVPVTVVRPFSGYGEDQDAAYPFRAILERVRRREDPLEIWGSGEQVRDWIHVDDLVAGALAVADSGTEDPVNLCTGVATPFTELARVMAAVAGYVPEIRPLADKPAGVAYRVGDPSRMLRYYAPKVSLEGGIRRALGVAPLPG
ncbi:NAD(P)-dependent oxidoreductase [Streptomyces sp. S1D4-14]|uniref:NAD-dependent epimerase/dehydratase family protein n=1 Tax=Streptomyces sp. S1D4-14 TaxID=2594461 RepID=UPI001164186E|nr:NAD(P)-dependent oxidoreductase [Streptomyces sp. S1D4-14]QDN64368.1 NAD(P)-dependent oxidoreductase [Streptomyces sp. S1D4-14]